MIKIKLERWKEIVRCSTENYFHEDIFKDVRILFNVENKVFYIPKIELSILIYNITKHNNSLKDDEYRWICDEECKPYKCVSTLPYNITPSGCIYPPHESKANWQPINNNKIEIVE